MAIQYLDDVYEFVRGEIRFPSDGRESLWVKINWENTDGRHFTFRIEAFPGKSESEVLGKHPFRMRKRLRSELGR